MKHYELTLLLSPDVGDEPARALFQKTVAFIQDQGGMIDKTEDPRQTALAYPVNKKMSGYLAVCSFFGKAEKSEAIHTYLKEMRETLRFLVVEKRKARASQSKGRSLRTRKPAPVESEIDKVHLQEVEKKLEELLNE